MKRGFVVSGGVGVSDPMTVRKARAGIQGFRHQLHQLQNQQQLKRTQAGCDFTSFGH